MKISNAVEVKLLLSLILFLVPIVVSGTPIPADKAELQSWFEKTVEAAGVAKTLQIEAPPKVIKVAKSGGEFTTVQAAIDSIPVGNKEHTVVSIGPGNYTEKITIPKEKPFITLYGTDPNDMPVLIFDGTAAKYTIVNSATLTADSENFMAVNLKIVNTAPRPDGKKEGAQAAALRLGADAAALYNCKIYGFQDTLFDFRGRHLIKDSYIEGTVDFIFGSGKSIYLNCEVHVIDGDGMAMIGAQARSDNIEDTGFVFVHCNVTGIGGHAVLARAWFPYPIVVYAYCEIGVSIKPEGWSNNFKPETNNTVYFAEYNNKGPGAVWDKRVTFAKKLTDEEAKPFIDLDFIAGTKWLRLPPKL